MLLYVNIRRKNTSWFYLIPLIKSHLKFVFTVYKAIRNYDYILRKDYKIKRTCILSIISCPTCIMCKFNNMRIVFSFSEKTYMYVQNNILVYTCLLKSSVVKLHRYDVCILLRICNFIHTRLKRKQQYKLHKCIKKWGRLHLHKVELNFLWYLIAGKVCSKENKLT